MRGETMAVRKTLLKTFVALGCAFGAVSPLAAQSDPVAELDDLSLQSDSAGSGVALARRQIGQGDLMAALATLERILSADANADSALLLHATLLCRLDDREGARAELVALDRPAPGPAWAEMTAACGPMPRPGPRG